jgi:outer membrane lipoprotein-sorting protein
MYGTSAVTRPAQDETLSAQLRCSARYILMLCSIITFNGASHAVESPPAQPARAILDHVKHLNDTTRAWTDRTQSLKIQIFDSRGNVRSREMTMRTQRRGGGEDKTLSVFLSPAEVRGTSFLQFAHRDRDAEQWLFLPALQRVRQISAQAKTESFMGTDFSYRDLELLTDVLEWTEEEASSVLKGADVIEGTEVSLIELTPHKKDVGYSRIVLALSQNDFVIRRMEFYSGSTATPQKVLRMDKIEMIGAIPTPRSLEMKQTTQGSHTTIDVSDVRYNQHLRDDLFTQRTLEHGAESLEVSED